MTNTERIKRLEAKVLDQAERIHRLEQVLVGLYNCSKSSLRIQDQRDAFALMEKFWKEIGGDA